MSMQAIFVRDGQKWKFVCEEEGTPDSALDKSQRKHSDGDELLVVCVDQVCPAAVEYTVSKKLAFKKRP